MEEFSVSLQSLIEEFGLQVLWMPQEEVLVKCADVNRPGLPLSGFFKLFDPTRIQIIGQHEYAYLTAMSEKERAESYRRFFAQKPVALIFTSGLMPGEICRTLAAEARVPLLATEHLTSEFMAILINRQHVLLAPRMTRHGVLVEVYGEGVLILGESGVGKSETAIELVKRGHRLIADDAVELKKVSHRSIVGNAPGILRHFIELRGIGIVDVKELFGMGAVKETEKVDMVIRLEPWVQGKMYDRLGMDTEYTDIMGVQIPTVVVPVRPGRNLAVIVEIAAMNNRQKEMGYNTAKEFNRRLMQQMEEETKRLEAEADPSEKR